MKFYEAPLFRFGTKDLLANHPEKRTMLAEIVFAQPSSPEPPADAAFIGWGMPRLANAG